MAKGGDGPRLNEIFIKNIEQLVTVVLNVLF